jgi:hypothetical protein
MSHTVPGAYDVIPLRCCATVPTFQACASRKVEA